MQQAALPVRDGLIGGHDFARSGCLHPPANGQTQRTPEESPAAKTGFFLCATQLTPITTWRDNRSVLFSVLLPLRAQRLMRQQCQGPWFPQVQRALVFLRDGLTADSTRRTLPEPPLDSATAVARDLHKRRPT